MTAQTDVGAKLSPNRFSKPTLTSVTDTSDIRCTIKSEGHKAFIGCYGVLRALTFENDKSFIRTHEPWSASERGDTKDLLNRLCSDDIDLILASIIDHFVCSITAVNRKQTIPSFFYAFAVSQHNAL